MIYSNSTSKLLAIGCLLLILCIGEKVQAANPPDEPFKLQYHRPSNFMAYGFELQVYPTGIIPGIRVEKIRNHHNINLRFGYQLINHRDLGVQESEKGTGFGFSFGYRYTFGRAEGWFLGARNDVWFNTIDWRDDIGKVDPMDPNISLERNGTSNIVVLQPTAEAGYTFPVGKNWLFSPSLSFGFEVNVQNSGEEVGQGPILLLGMSFMKD